jgi:hypothetical protein
MTWAPHTSNLFFLGGTDLLTDPQIITASYVSEPDFQHNSNPKFYRDIGHIFSDGNISLTLATFPTEHICNMFCKFFKLPSPSADEFSNTDEHGEGSKIAEAEIIN